MQQDLTEGSIVKLMLKFSVPYLLACFLQTFYGMADLFIAGQFNGAATISAVAIGSQIMHMVTVMLVGLAMGGTVMISRSVGAKDREETAKSLFNTIVLFAGVAIGATAILIFFVNGIIRLISTPPESVAEARSYLVICFAGIVFITAYNVIAGIFRGLGDSKSPMVFVFIAGVVNIILDYILIGPFKMGAAGAAYATIFSQAVSVVFALTALLKNKDKLPMERSAFRFDGTTMGEILKIGFPISMQDGFIQISFLVITAIANARGVETAAAVGIVEKIICFLFLVPSAMLSTVSAMAAQNAGAGLHDRSRKILRYACTIGIIFGVVVSVITQFAAEGVLRLFAGGEPEVIRLGTQYFKTYVLDCIVAAVHFSFSGYFCAYKKSIFSFIHNLLSVLLFRIPGAYIAFLFWPISLYAMGLAAPLGSLFSAVVCVILYKKYLSGNDEVQA